VNTAWTKESLIAFEEDIKAEFLAAKIHAPVHLAGGNEEQLIRIFKEVNEEDWLFLTYRNHYHCLLKGMPAERLKRHIMEGRSMYLCDRDYRIVSPAIVGGCLPIAVGFAMGLVLDHAPGRVWAFCGDMAAETGVFHEATKYAGSHKLPITFVVEDNGLSTNTPTREVWGGGLIPSFLARDYGAFIKYYRYERTVPHVGAGKFVVFA
jgi:pyruvate dehydrogenase E1 component alpha subunit